MDSSPIFFRLGKWIYRYRGFIIFLWFVIVLACIPFLPRLTAPFKTMGFVDDTSKSVKADDFLEKRLGYNQRIVIGYESRDLKTDNPLFLKKIKNSLSAIKNFKYPPEIIYPSKDNKQFSKDKRHALTVVLFKTKTKLTEDDIIELKALIKTPKSMRITLGGEPIFMYDINQQTKTDLYKADIIAAPVSILIMILVFGSLVAAGIPIILGGVCALVMLTSLFFLAHVLTLSVFTLNISLLLGLCLSLDYSLFIMSRFREELRNGIGIEDALALTMGHAGKAIFFSGLAVFISLSALLIFPVTILFSLGIGGLAAVFFAVSVSMILLPAMLAFVKYRVNSLPVRIFKNTDNRHHFWRWLAEKVVRRPFLFFFPSLIFLMFLSAPFLNAKFGISDAHILPEHTESRKFIKSYKQYFNEYQLTPIIVIASSKNKILSEKALADLYDLTRKIKSDSRVSEVNSIVSGGDKKITKKQYYQLYKMSKKMRGKEMNQLLKTTSGDKFTVIHVVSKYPVDAAETTALARKLQDMPTYKGLSLQISGFPVNNMEVMETIKSLFPYAVVWILSLTYLILLLLLRSIFLPFKAIVMNIISLSASYGVLVWVFQEGNLQDFLNFVPQGMLDTSLLIIIFCALFGFSMDYEVFLLTRMKECYEKTKSNSQSIIAGIDQSSRIITSAAIIVIVLCGSFMAAEVLMVKEFGLGIAIAIFVDAFLVRSLLMPSIMAMIGDWNWYLPKWLQKILPQSKKMPKIETQAPKSQHIKKE